MCLCVELLKGILDHLLLEVWSTLGYREAEGAGKASAQLRSTGQLP
jgi:hypothetical protein